ncbi:hypothetical protein C0Q70_20115 [Pomacea canaliculata]|uniref:15-hydroxyprostaglandin dehydrogenase [NAD(+)] n=1 Tax=Pomacea canaliculata TaxID=400727 RepID=A0A2T7NEQ4_POMCA|nr:hypothetical protein C0Q70_20115 [Pomacea canaliculata]
MDPRGKGVFLTGGAQGLGRGIVEELLSLGAKVLFCDVDVERGRATESELRTQYGADVVFFQPADVSDDEQHKVSQVVQAVMKLIRDPDNNGAILEVSHEKGARYRRRQVVDRDDVSDVEEVDTY